MVFPRLSREQLQVEVTRSADEYLEARRVDEARRVSTRYEQFERGLADLLRASNDLTDIAQAVRFASQGGRSHDPEAASALDVLRLVTMPPLGPADVRSLWRASRHKRSLSSEERDRLEALIPAQFDPRRFPWLADGRRPTDCERQVALCATATLAVAQSLPIISRQVAMDQERGVTRQLIELGWERLPRQMPLWHLPVGTFIREPAGRGPDLAARFPDGTTVLVEVKATMRTDDRLHGVAQQMESWSERVGLHDYTPALILLGGARVDALLALQEAGVAIVFGHSIPHLFALRDRPRRAVREAAAGSAADPPEEPLWQYSAEHLAGQMSPPTPSEPGPDIATATDKIRAAAALLRERIGPQARVGRLGRRKSVPVSDGYRGQYVHFTDDAGDRLAFWIYFAEEGHDYSVPGYPTGFWVGLKHDPAKELPEALWSARLRPSFTWMAHVDPRWAGFRHFLDEVSIDEDDDDVARAIADWAFTAFERLADHGT